MRKRRCTPFPACRRTWRICRRAAGSRPGAPGPRTSAGPKSRPWPGRRSSAGSPAWPPGDGRLTVTVIGQSGPDAASTGLVGSDAESLDAAAASDNVGYVHDASLADTGTSGATSEAPEAQPVTAEEPAAAEESVVVVVAGGLAETADGRLEVTERRVEVAAVNGNGAAPLLELRNLVKEFPVTSGAILQRRVASVKAVSDVSFAVPAGTTFGLVGESGCGKTTIGKLIVALERPNSGSISVNGEDVSKLHRADLRRSARTCPSCTAPTSGASAATCS